MKSKAQKTNTSAQKLAIQQDAAERNRRAEHDALAEENLRLKHLQAEQALELELLRAVQKKMDAHSKSEGK